MDHKAEVKQVFFGVTEDQDDEASKLDPEDSEDSSEEEDLEASDSEEENSEEEDTEGEDTKTVEEEEEETLEQRYARLLEEHNAVNAQLLKLQSMQSPGAQTPQLPSAQVQQADQAAMRLLNPQPIVQPALEISDDEINKVLVDGDVGAFKGILQKVAAHAAQVGEAYRESTLRAVPDMAIDMAMGRMQLMMAVQEFYKENNDLVPHSATVGAITNQIVAENPTLTLKEVFDKVETVTRKRLGLKKKILSDDTATGRERPGFMKKTGSRKPGAPVLSDSVKSEIAKMQAAMNRR